MKTNVGNADKIIRIIAGLLILFVGGIVYHTWWALVGLILIGTALINWCPIYAALKISTAKRKSKPGITWFFSAINPGKNQLNFLFPVLRYQIRNLR